MLKGITVIIKFPKGMSVPKMKRLSSLLSGRSSLKSKTNKREAITKASLPTLFREKESEKFSVASFKITVRKLKLMIIHIPEKRLSKCSVFIFESLLPISAKNGKESFRERPDPKTHRMNALTRAIKTFEEMTAAKMLFLSPFFISASKKSKTKKPFIPSGNRNDLKSAVNELYFTGKISFISALPRLKTKTQAKTRHITIKTISTLLKTALNEEKTKSEALKIKMKTISFCGIYPKEVEVSLCEKARV